MSVRFVKARGNVFGNTDIKLPHLIKYAEA